MRALACAVVLVGLVSSAVAGASGEDLPRRPVFGAYLAEGPGDTEVSIVGLLEGGPAMVAGFEVGDVLTSFGGEPIDALGAAYAGRLTHGRRANEFVEVMVRRSGEVRPKTLALGERPPATPDGMLAEHSVAQSPTGERCRTILTVPIEETGELRPAVLFIGGRDVRTIDPEVPRASAWSELAEEIGRSGCVTMRMDPPGVGDSDGPPIAELDFEAELGAYRAAFATLAAHPEVDPERVFICAIGTGTAIAGLIAVDAPVAGVIACGAFVRPWPEVMLAQTRAVWGRAGGSEQLEVGLSAAHHVIAETVMRGRGLRELWEDRPELRGAINALGDRVYGTVHRRSLAYWRQLAGVEMAKIWRVVGTPVLLLHGEWDLHTIAGDQQRIATLINRSDEGDAWVFAAPRTDERLAVQEHEWAVMTKAAGHALSPEVREMVLGWLEMQHDAPPGDA